MVALGRKNFLFVGHEDAGSNIAGLYSLVSTCEAYGKNPIAYLTDVLTRVGNHPHSRIDRPAARPVAAPSYAGAQLIARRHRATIPG